MRHLLIATLAFVAVAAMGCPLDPAKTPPCTGHETWPNPCAGAKDGTSCSLACAHLRELSCKEGAAPTCEDTCQAALGVTLSSSWPDCVAGAADKTALSSRCNVRCRQ